jgi:hypothetical protein
MTAIATPMAIKTNVAASLNGVLIVLDFPMYLLRLV